MRRSFDELVELMAQLRAPGGCPWDREQKLEDLKPFIIEEAYEVVDAIDRGDHASLKEEVGDLLLEAVFVAGIMKERNVFDIFDSVTAVHDKLVRRHPHVFGEVTAHSAEEVLVNWEKQKSTELKQEKKGLLSGVPNALPALLKASRLTEKAARIGFDWRKDDDVLEKLDEEIGELKEALAKGDQSEIEHEIGDLLFTMVNLARRLGVNAEEALQSTNRKFIRRFGSIESALETEGRTFEQATLEDLDQLWDEAKKQE